MLFRLTILGSAAALPILNRHTTAQHLRINQTHILIDCGEGTQQQMLKYKINALKIDFIFISHLHGDHYLGLMGLISSMHTMKREKDLYIFAPKGLDEIIGIQMKYSRLHLNFKIHLQEVCNDAPTVIFSQSHFQVWALPMNHRIECYGYLFKQISNKRKTKPEYAQLFETMDSNTIKQLLSGKNVLNQLGELRYDYELLTQLLPVYSYAYLADTAFSAEIALFLAAQHVDWLYHEATFLEEDKERAEKTFHSTAKQAAEIAVLSKVRNLLIGHFSARYTKIQTLQDEAKQVFENTFLALEGSQHDINL
ncbi:MAG: ribonuclease Z [Cytophagales bacterium]|nr:MAG: ribonuclease Z [Cytophagales bacterium]